MSIINNELVRKEKLRRYGWVNFIMIEGVTNKEPSKGIWLFVTFLFYFKSPDREISKKIKVEAFLDGMQELNMVCQKGVVVYTTVVYLNFYLFIHSILCCTNHN